MTAPAGGSRRGPVRIVGLGNPHRGDDDVGLRVVEALRSQVPPSVQVRAHSGEPMDLLEEWEGAELAVVVDAIRSGHRPGYVHRAEVEGGALPTVGSAASTHALDLARTVELGQVLGRLPHRLVVWGVEGVRFGMGDVPTPAVLAAVPEVVAGVLREVTHA